MTVLTKPEEIEAARILALRQALRLEIKGMKASRGRVSAYRALLDSGLGFHGTRAEVLEQVSQWRDQLLGGAQ